MHDGQAHGHTHGHTHQHGQGCCGHDGHSHGLGHRGLAAGSGSDGLSVSVHEDATIGSLTLSGSGDGEAAELRLKQQVQQLAERVESAGGMVGHIKCAVSYDGSVLLVSCTGAGGGVQANRHLFPDYRIELAAIVFDVEPKQLDEMLNELFL